MPRFQQMLDEMQSMDWSVWQQFLKQFRKIERKQEQNLPGEQRTILQRLRTGGLDDAAAERQVVLAGKKAREIISEQETEELERLVNRFDSWNLERAKLLVRLSELTGLPVHEVIEAYQLQTRAQRMRAEIEEA